MNKVYKIALICFATNMMFILFMFVDPTSENFIGVGLLWIFYLIIQLIGGLILSFIPARSEFGKGVLLGAGISMLIGFSICSGLIR
ncbi:MAG TPA: hypothetical protein VGB71_00305 [Flavisolibacter sp.]|jgi:Na+-transporting NADH:ubiquinone oxidoreductase subunit NqrB